jgi:choline dehydrogenase-like flavoprotein
MGQVIALRNGEFNRGAQRAECDLTHASDNETKDTVILDSSELPDGLTLTADICIVGAGAAGVTLALDLAQSGLDVLVLESGGRTEEPQTQLLYAGAVADARLHSPPDRYRQRRFGGTTAIWGGRCMPFDAIDFEHRDFIPESGWPFGCDTLDPYYHRANRLCEAGRFAYSIESAFDRPMRPMIEGFRSEHFTTNSLERFSCPTNFGARYEHRLAAARNVRVLLHANATSIDLKQEGSAVESISVRTLEGKTFSIRAHDYVLATGGLEVPRLLLASRSVHSHGVGNEFDVVGRYYMCHIAGTVGAIKLNLPLSSVWHGYEIADEGTYVRRRFALRAETQRSMQIGNFIARLHHPRITDPDHRSAILSLLFLAQYFIPYEYRIRLHGGTPTTFVELMQHIRNVAVRPFDTVGFAWHMLRDRRMAERKFPSIIVRSRANLYSLDFHAEQEPNQSSRVTLIDECDALGMPRIKVDWRYTEGDVRTVTRAIALLADDIRCSGAGTFDYDPATLETEMTRYGAYGGHHIGTARMGSNPRTSVVDADCRVHGVQNLYIAGAATFPTSGQANPTLTIVALALRLANRLKTSARTSSLSPNKSSGPSTVS